jgi:Cu(I)/Ag(I) efflux system membrane fusion protein
MNMLSAYYSLKDALVATSSTKADEAASKLLSAAELFNHGLGNKPEYATLHPELQRVMSTTDALIALKNEDIEGKRTKFADISDAMYKVATLSRLKNAGVYHQYCPMAMNDKGAYWLSAESEIKNPYYGKKMLECGEVKDSL